MTDLITREWNGQVIRQREDGYINATDMCTSCGKYFNDWFKTNGASRYLEALSSRLNIPIRNNPEAKIFASAQPRGFQALVNVIKGGDPQEQGTWVHRKVAIRLAQWLSPELAIQVDDWIEELFETGKVELTEHPENNKPQSAIDVLEQVFNSFKEHQAKLNQHEDKLVKHTFEINETKNELDILKDRIEEYRNKPDAENAKFSIDQYCRINNLEPSRGQSISGGRKLTSLARLLAIDFNDNGTRKNEYPYWLLKALFDTVLDFDVDFAFLIQKYLEYQIKD